jgi:hypothetical protein
MSAFTIFLVPRDSSRGLLIMEDVNLSTGNTVDTDQKRLASQIINDVHYCGDLSRRKIQHVSLPAIVKIGTL